MVAEPREVKTLEPPFELKQKNAVPETTLDVTDPQYRKIFVGGLPHNLSLSEFKSYFQQFGLLEDCVILKDKRTQKPRGFGFVTYSDLECATKVMQLKDQHVIQGKWVDCKSAVPVAQMKALQLKQKEINQENNIDSLSNGKETNPLEMNEPDEPDEPETFEHRKPELEYPSAPFYPEMPSEPVTRDLLPESTPAIWMPPPGQDLTP